MDREDFMIGKEKKKTEEAEMPTERKMERKADTKTSSPFSPISENGLE